MPLRGTRVPIVHESAFIFFFFFFFSKAMVGCRILGTVRIVRRDRLVIAEVKSAMMLTHGSKHVTGQTYRS